MIRKPKDSCLHKRVVAWAQIVSDLLNQWSIHCASHAHNKKHHTTIYGTFGANPERAVEYTVKNSTRFVAQEQAKFLPVALAHLQTKEPTVRSSATYKLVSNFAPIWMCP